VKKILVIQLRRIGDIIVTTPVIDAVKAAYPDAAVDFLAEPLGEPVLRGYPGLNELILLRKDNFLKTLLDLRRRRYDMALDFMNNPRSAQATLATGAPVRAGFETPGWGLVYNRRIPRPAGPRYAVQNKFDLLRAVGLTPPESGVFPRIPYGESDFSGAKSWWEANGLDRFPVRIGLAPAHRHEIRQWPTSKWAALLPSLLKKDGRAVLLFGGPGEEGLLESLAKPFPGRVFVIPAGPLRQAAALMARCRVVASNCSGSMHLAVSAGVPTVTLYGPTSPESWNPKTLPHRYVQAAGLACLGCHRDVCPFKHECMEWIAPERVAGEIEAAIA
jgi:ADP-heptose:LPS heptosyltransferase